MGLGATNGYWLWSMKILSLQFCFWFLPALNIRWWGPLIWPQCLHMSWKLCVMVSNVECFACESIRWWDLWFDTSVSPNWLLYVLVYMGRWGFCGSTAACCILVTSNSFSVDDILIHFDATSILAEKMEVILVECKSILLGFDRNNRRLTVYVVHNPTHQALACFHDLWVEASSGGTWSCWSRFLPNLLYYWSIVCVSWLCPAPEWKVPFEGSNAHSMLTH